MHLPSLPTVKDNTLDRLLVNPNTAPDLGWALLEQVDPNSLIDGVPLLQAFCQDRASRALYTIGSLGGVADQPLPTSAQEPWPDPRQGADGKWQERFPSPEMWIFASLACNGPDPFAWRMQDGRDVLDFVIRWNNPQLLDQMLRMPSCPPVAELQTRIFNLTQKTPWLHGLAHAEQHRMLAVLLQHGFDPHQRMSKQLTALHLARSPACAEMLQQAGVDPLSVDKDGNSVPTAWGEAAFARGNTAHSPEYDLQHRLVPWSVAAAAIDPDRARAAITPVVFQSLTAAKGMGIFNDACKHHQTPVGQWCHPNTGRSVLGVLARDSLRSNKSPLVPKLCVLAATIPPATLLAPRDQGVSDLAWGWMACRNHGSQSEGASYVNKLLACLGGDPVEQVHELWAQVQPLASMKVPVNQSKLDESLTTAFSNEVYALVEERAHYVRSASSAMGPRLSAVLDRPEHLFDLVRWPLGENAASGLAVCLRELGHTQEHIAPQCLVALGGMLQNPKLPVRARESVFNGLQALHNDGVRWDPCQRGAREALLAIEEVARTKASFGTIASELLASCIELETPGSSATTSRPRL